MDIIELLSVSPIIITAFVLVMVISFWKIFQKAGQAGWKSLIPFYNFIIVQRIIGKPWWWLILMLIPIVNVIFAIWQVNLIAKVFGKSTGFTIGILIFPYIFYPVLAFGDAKYIGPVKE